MKSSFTQPFNELFFLFWVLRFCPSFLFSLINNSSIFIVIFSKFFSSRYLYSSSFRNLISSNILLFKFDDLIFLKISVLCSVYFLIFFRSLSFHILFLWLIIFILVLLWFWMIFFLLFFIHCLILLHFFIISTDFNFHFFIWW